MSACRRLAGRLFHSFGPAAAKHDVKYLLGERWWRSMEINASTTIPVIDLTFGDLDHWHSLNRNLAVQLEAGWRETLISVQLRWQRVTKTRYTGRINTPRCIGRTLTIICFSTRVHVHTDYRYVDGRLTEHCDWVIWCVCVVQPRERGNTRFHKIQNVQIALNYLTDKRVGFLLRWLGILLLCRCWLYIC